MENFYPITLEMEERAETISTRVRMYVTEHHQEMLKMTFEQNMKIYDYLEEQEKKTPEELNMMTPMEILEILEDCAGE